MKPINIGMRALFLCTVAFALFRAVSACAETAGTLVIGMPVCLSGPCAISGTNALHGAALAVEDLNARGGVLGKKLALEVEDSQDAVSGARAVTAYRALRQRKDIKLFVGPSWTPGLLALAPIVSREPSNVMISYDGGIKEFHEAGANLFNIRGVDEATTRELARFAFRAGARRMAIFGGQQAWELDQGRFFEDELKNLGATLAIKIEPPSASGDLRDEALKVVSKKPDAILFSAYLQLDLALKALDGLGYSGPKIVCFIDSSRITLAGKAIEGAITLNSLRLDEAFRRRLEKEYPATEATWHAHTAYDAVMMYAKAIVKTGSFNSALLAGAIKDMELPDGMSGPFEFGGGRLALRKGNNFKIVKNGALIPYTP